MGIQSFVPSGGGGTPGFDYIASIRMETYNRSWSQGGAAGNYVVTSNNNNSGYAYFVGAVTIGIPLGQVINLTQPFTRIDIVAPTNDYISLHKVAVKPTTVFDNALAGFSSFPSILTSSGNFVLPNASLPLVDVMIVGGGGGAPGHASGGGGGGIVRLTAYQAVGTTSVTVGASGGNANGSRGGDSYFGNVYALGGGGGFYGRSNNYTVNPQAFGFGANGAGAGHGSTGEGGTGSSLAGYPGTTQTSSTGLGTKGTPVYSGGHAGGALTGNFTPNHGGAGGGGAGGVGGNRSSASSGSVGGIGHTSDFTGANLIYGTGGGGSHHSGPEQSGSYPTQSFQLSYGTGRNSSHGDSHQSGVGNGAVIVRYYIP